MTFLGELRPYQAESVDFMVQRKQALVAFDMGTGKTPMTIAAVENIADASPGFGGTLVICLLSVKYQWQKEIHKFSDKTAIVVDGTPAQRAKQWAALGDYDYAILNYEQVHNDWDSLAEWNFDALVMDEATALKSFRSKRTQGVRALSQTIPVRFALTGQPIENGKPEELYSIMQSVDPAVLGLRFDIFDRSYIVRDGFGGVKSYRNLDVLNNKLKTCSVRKKQTDPDVAPYMPDEVVRPPITVAFDRAGAAVYRRIAALLIDDIGEVLDHGGSTWTVESHYGQENERFDPVAMELRGKMMSKITALRMLCDHPRLLLSSAEKWDPMVGKEGSKFLNELIEDNDDIAALLARAHAPKLAEATRVVNDHLSISDDNKIVVFTSYVEMADMLQEAVGGVVYTGQMNAKQKERAKEMFQTSPDVRVFISTDAGGYGVDLPQANMLVNYDTPWSAGLAAQRNARIKRTSSTWPTITIQDLLMERTTEEHYYGVLRRKDAVASAILDGEGINAEGGIDLSVAALIAFLRETMP